MDFSITTDLIGESRERVQAWIVEYWKAIEEEEPDNEYIDYIMTMIDNRKTIHEIGEEIKEIAEESTASDFANKLAKVLPGLVSSTSADSKDNSTEKEDTASSKVISVSSSEKDSKFGALKTSREGKTVGTDGSKKLLQSALGASRASANDSRVDNNRSRDNRGNVKTGRGPGSHRSVEEKNMNDNRNRDFNDRDNRKRNRNDFNDQGSRKFQGGRGNDFGRAPPVTGVDPSGTLKYFEEMNKVAQMSGFENAKEMMTMMASQNAPPVVAPWGMGMPPHGMYPPPYPMAAPPVWRGGRGRSNFGGRGRGRGRFAQGTNEGEPQTTPEMPSTSENTTDEAPSQTIEHHPQPSDPADENGNIFHAEKPAEAVGEGGAIIHAGRGGRFSGRGRSGRFHAPAAAFGSDSNMTLEQLAQMNSSGFAGRFAGGYRGRAPALGRGYRGGRGRASAGRVANKTWVREPDVETPLVSGRD